jgi:hypothetical protein
VSGPLIAGGTGRCGTQLKRVLGGHPQMHALERDSRFLVNRGGFEDLARAPTVACTSSAPMTRWAA